jgi:hypothetical protein
MAEGYQKQTKKLNEKTLLGLFSLPANPVFIQNLTFFE